MAKIALLLADTNSDLGSRAYTQLGGITELKLVPISNEADLQKEEVASAEILVWVPGGPPSLIPLIMEKAKIQWIHSWFAGIDAIHQHIKDTPVPVTNARTAYSQPLAEFVVGATLHFLKCFPCHIENQKQKRWHQFTSEEIAGKTFGFIGFGDIARCTATMLKNAFNDIRVLAVRNNANGPGSDLADEVYTCDNEEGVMRVLRTSDVVVCALPGTEKTRGFMGMKQFAAMMPTSIFINIGRGYCVNEKDMIEVLKAKTIKAAALDVFEVEPLSKESGLWDLDNVLLTSHCADWVPTYHRRAVKVFTSNLNLYLAGKRVHEEFVTPVSKEMGY